MVKYFLVISRPPGYALVVISSICALGIVTTWLSPKELDSSLGMVLFVQMLLASSGFAPAARRGHFDPVLVRGHSRDRALAAQWLASVLPGAAAWTVVTLTGLYCGSGAAVSALAGRRLAAFWIVSALTWCVGFLLPRGAGAAIWIGALIVLLLWHADLVAARPSPGALGITRASATLLLCPFLLLGSHVAPGAAEIAAAAAAAALLLVATWRGGKRLDVYLAERT